VRSEQLANIGVEVYAIGVGDSVKLCVLHASFNLHIYRHHCGSNCVNALERHCGRISGDTSE
jgi:hypothetical protein